MARQWRCTKTQQGHEQARHFNAPTEMHPAQRDGSAAALPPDKKRAAMNRSPFSTLFHNAVASRASDWLTADRLEPVARRLRAIARGWRQGQPLPQLVQPALDDDVSPIDLADALDWIATNLIGPQVLHSALPAWVQFAQAHRDSLPFQYVPDLVEAVLDLLLPELPLAEQNLIDRYMSDCLDAADQFQLRHAAGTDAEAIGQEVCAGLESVLATIGEDLDDARLGELPRDIGAAIAGWSSCSADMGVVVDLEFVRRVITDVVAPRRLSSRGWTLVMLRLERALAARAPHRIEHALADVTSALLAACPRFGFLADVVNSALLYLPPERQFVGEFAIALVVARQATDGRFSLRIASTMKLTEVATAVGEDEVPIAEAVRLSCAALRANWERNYIDEYDDSCRRILQWAGQGRWLLGVDHGQRGAERIALDCIEAATTGADGQLRVALLRQWVAQSPFADDVGGVAAALERHVPMGLSPALAQLAASALAAMDHAALRDPATGAARVAALVDGSVGEHALPRRILQRHFMFRRTVGADEAGRRLHATLVARLLGNRDGSEPEEVAQLDRVIRWTAGSREVVPALRVAADAIAHCVVAARTSYRIIEHAGAIATESADHVVAAVPEFAERVGARLRDSIARDNRYALERLAVSLGLPSTQSEWDFTWWWSTAIGSYLAFRDNRAMVANLAGFTSAIRDRLGAEEASLARKVMFAAYRNALGIEIPYSLTDGDALHFLALGDRGPVWTRLNSRDRRIEPYQRAANWAGSHSAELGAAAVAYDRAVDAGADLLVAWSSPDVVPADLDEAGARALTIAVQHALVDSLRSADAVEVAFAQVLATGACERIAAVSMARVIATRTNAVAAAMATAARAVPETPAAQAAEYERKGRRDIALLLGQLRSDLLSSSPRVARLNAGRFVVEALVPFVTFSPASWLRMWTRGIEVLMPGLEPALVGFASDTFGLLAAITSRADVVRPSAGRIFAQRNPVFNSDPDLEIQWRALASGLIVAACAEDAGHDGLALAQQVALSATILDDDGIATLREGRAAVCELVTEGWPAQLSKAFADCVDVVLATHDAAVPLESGGNLSVVDLTVATRSRDPAAALLWRTDRAVLATTRGMSTPMPGDHAVARAAGWQTPDMIAVRRTCRMVEEAAGLVPDDPVTAVGLLAVSAWASLLRENAPFNSVDAATTALLGGVWAAETAEKVQARLTRAIDEARRSLDPDAELIQRLAQAEQTIFAATALRNAVSLDWRGIVGADSELLSGICLACLRDRPRARDATREDASARRRLGDLLNSHLSNRLSVRQINLLIARIEAMAA